MSNEELLALDVDVLIPAALGGVLTKENAKDVRARWVVEAANGPTTPEAEEILLARGNPPLPDIYANAGGVTVSYFEWVQNIQQFTWSEERFLRELASRLNIATRATIAKAEHRGVTMREAAFALGIERVADASHLRG